MLIHFLSLQEQCQCRFWFKSIVCSVCKHVCLWRHVQAKVLSCRVCVAVAPSEKESLAETPRQRREARRRSWEHQGDFICKQINKTTFIFKQAHTCGEKKPSKELLLCCTDITWKGYLALFWIWSLLSLHRCDFDTSCPVFRSCLFEEFEGTPNKTSRICSGSKLRYQLTALIGKENTVSIQSHVLYNEWTLIHLLHMGK